MIRETLSSLAANEPCMLRDLAADMGISERECKDRLRVLLGKGYARIIVRSDNVKLYAVSGMGRVYMASAPGEVALPRTVNKMAGVYVPPAWPAVIR